MLSPNKNFQGLLFIVALFISAPSHAKIVEHAHLKEKLQQAACQQEKWTTEKLWKIGFTKTQVAMGTVSFKGALNLQKLRVFIEKKAHHKSHNAFTFGRCPNKTAWYATFPSPMRVTQSAQRIEFHLKGMNKYCRSAAVYFASQNGGRARKLATTKFKPAPTSLIINTAFLPAGSLSFNCRPRTKTISTVLWELIPVHDAGHTKLPFDHLLKETNTAIALTTWINAVRRENLMAPLKPTQSMVRDTLLKNPTINHFKSNVDKAAKILKRKGKRFIGENRVIGDNHEDMAWMLWNSPSHRSLLLNTNATHFDVGTRPLGQETLAIIMLEAH